MKARKWVVLAAILWTAFIWGNSLQTASESAGMSSIVLDLFRPLLSWTGLSEDTMHTIVRKLAHMTEFAVLGLLCSAGVLIEVLGTKRKLWQLRCCIVLIGIVVAVIDESIQKFIPGRSGEIKDICIDAVGVVLGVCLQYLIARSIQKRQMAKNKKRT